MWHQSMRQKARQSACVLQSAAPDFIHKIVWIGASSVMAYRGGTQPPKDINRKVRGLRLLC